MIDFEQLEDFIESRKFKRYFFAVLAGIGTFWMLWRPELGDGAARLKWSLLVGTVAGIVYLIYARQRDNKLETSAKN